MKLKKLFLQLHFLLSLFFFLICSYSKCQIPFSNGNEIEIPGRFTKLTGQACKYKGEANYKSIFELNPDSTFVFYSPNPLGYLSLGRYSIKGDFICFNWDSLKTYQSTSDSNICKIYLNSFKPYPYPFKLSNKYFLFDSKSHEAFEKPKTYDAIEVFFSSKEVFNHGLIIDSLRYFPFPYTINYNENKFILNRKFGKNIVFPLDSVWGYRQLIKGGNNYVFRLNGNPANLPVIVYENLVIYEFSTGKNRFYYFSDNLDSEIMSLNKSSLEKHFKNNKCFMQALKEEKGMISPVYKKTGEFKVIAIYRKCKD